MPARRTPVRCDATALCQQQSIAFMQLARQTRIERGWTQAELAQRIGVGQWRISDMERHPEHVTLDHVFLLAQALDLDITVKRTRKQ